MKLSPALPLLCLALATSACFSTVNVPQPAGEPLPVTPGMFPHEAFSAVLAKHVDGHGKVDYRGLRADRRELERYLVAIAQTSPRKDPAQFPRREDKLAYWINAYNAYVLYAVTERPAMRSVNEDAKSFFYFTQYRFGGEEISLYKVENEVVRPEFKEPRVHFALNCASGGCPALPAEAFLPGRLEEQLARESREFCADDAKVKPQGAVVQVSQIFEWYKEDFEAAGGPLAFCRQHGRELPAGTLEFIPYDWTLNAQPGKALFDP